MGVTHVFRGNDLLDSTPYQVFLMENWDTSRQSTATCPCSLTKKASAFPKDSGALP